MSKKIILLLAVSFSFNLTSCAKNPASGGYDVMFYNEEEEYEWGHDISRDEIKKHGLYKEKEDLTKYYQRLSANIVDVSERSGKPFEFIMLDSDQFNAWAIPGYVNMYRGIMPFFNSEAEFMTVLAHEAGHINARHTARTQTKADIANAAIVLIGIGVATASDSDEAGIAAIGAGLYAAQYGFAAYSRGYEDEADGLAIRYLNDLGYDLDAAEKMYKTMDLFNELRDTQYKYFHDGKERPENGFYDLLDSHPKSDKRAERAKKRAKIQYDKNSPKIVNQDVYFEKIDGIAFGPNAQKHGVVAGRNFYNPSKRFKMQLPQGFYANFNGSGWEGYDNVNKVRMNISYTRMDKKQDAEEVLRVAEPKLRQITPIKVNGMDGYTGVQYKYKQEDGIFAKKELVAVERVFGIKGVTVDPARPDSRYFYKIVFETKTEKDFKRLDDSFFKSAESITVLSKTQAESIQPLRVKIYTVKEGDTVESLAHAMPFEDLKALWFRTINGMNRGDKLTVGQKIKIIIDPNKNLNL